MNRPFILLSIAAIQLVAASVFAIHGPSPAQLKHNDVAQGILAYAGKQGPAPMVLGGLAGKTIGELAACRGLPTHSDGRALSLMGGNPTGGTETRTAEDLMNFMAPTAK